MNEWKILDRRGNPNRPWLDVRLTEKTMNHLWKINDSSEDHEDARKGLIGNISRSDYVLDKDDLFYKNVLKECVEYMYFRDWQNYYDVVVSKSRPIPRFKLKRLWTNYQKQTEFNPPHNHDGLFSFVVFMKIPTHWKEQHALPITKNSFGPKASNFQFLFGAGQSINATDFQLSPEDEGRMLFFPAWVYHQVFPFYGTDVERITMSGNITDEQDLLPYSIEEEEQRLEKMRLDTIAMESYIRYEKRMKND